MSAQKDILVVEYGNINHAYEGKQIECPECETPDVYLTIMLSNGCYECHYQPDAIQLEVKD